MGYCKKKLIVGSAAIAVLGAGAAVPPIRNAVADFFKKEATEIQTEFEQREAKNRTIGEMKVKQESYLDSLGSADNLESVLFYAAASQSLDSKIVLLKSKNQNRITDVTPSLQDFKDRYREIVNRKLSEFLPACAAVDTSVHKGFFSGCTVDELRFFSGVLLMSYKNVEDGKKLIENYIDKIGFVERPDVFRMSLWFYSQKADRNSIKILLPLFLPKLSYNELLVLLEYSNSLKGDYSGRDYSEFAYNSELLNRIFSIDDLAQEINCLGCQSLFVKTEEGLEEVRFQNPKNGPFHYEIIMQLRNSLNEPNPNHLKLLANILQYENDPGLRELILEGVEEIAMINPRELEKFKPFLERDVPIAISSLVQEKKKCSSMDEEKIMAKIIGDLSNLNNKLPRNKYLWYARNI